MSHNIRPIVDTMRYTARLDPFDFQICYAVRYARIRYVTVPSMVWLISLHTFDIFVSYIWWPCEIANARQLQTAQNNNKHHAMQCRCRKFHDSFTSSTVVYGVCFVFADWNRWIEAAAAAVTMRVKFACANIDPYFISLHYPMNVWEDKRMTFHMRTVVLWQSRLQD